MNHRDDMLRLAHADDDTVLAVLRDALDEYDGAETALYGRTDELSDEDLAALRTRISAAVLVCGAVHRCQPGTVHSPRPLATAPHPVAGLSVPDGTARQGPGQTTRPVSLDGPPVGSLNSGRGAFPEASRPDSTSGGAAGSGPVALPGPRTAAAAYREGAAARLTRWARDLTPRRIAAVTALVLLAIAAGVAVYGVVLARLFHLI